MQRDREEVPGTRPRLAAQERRQEPSNNLEPHHGLADLRCLQRPLSHGVTSPYHVPVGGYHLQKGYRQDVKAEISGSVIREKGLQRKDLSARNRAEDVWSGVKIGRRRTRSRQQSLFPIARNSWVSSEDDKINRAVGDFLNLLRRF